jgi:hypothetical protein
VPTLEAFGVLMWACVFGALCMPCMLLCTQLQHDPFVSVPAATRVHTEYCECVVWSHVHEHVFMVVCSVCMFM